jgi:hypothetical protein
MALAGVSTVLALGVAACSMPVKIPAAEIPPEQYLDMNCDALNAERTRLVAERADLKSPLLASNTDAEREAELAQLNGKLYTVAKAQSDKSCPAVANLLLYRFAHFAIGECVTHVSSLQLGRLNHVHPDTPNTELSEVVTRIRRCSLL